MYNFTERVARKSFSLSCHRKLILERIIPRDFFPTEKFHEGTEKVPCPDIIPQGYISHGYISLGKLFRPEKFHGG